jgi:hypothetical protein
MALIRLTGRVGQALDDGRAGSSPEDGLDTVYLAKKTGAVPDRTATLWDDGAPPSVPLGAAHRSRRR